MGNVQRNVTIFGLKNAGKTTILDYLRGISIGAVVRNSRERVGYRISVENAEMTLWEFGSIEDYESNSKITKEKLNGIIYVIDSSNTKDFDSTITRLTILISEANFKHLPLVLFFNKQDKSRITLKKLQEAVGKDTPDAILYAPCTAKTGENLIMGIEWLDAIMTCSRRKLKKWKKMYANKSL